MNRRAMSLVEVTIAAGILISVMAAILQVTVAARSYEATSSAQDEIAADAASCLRFIGEDLARSGWHIPDGTTSLALESALDTSGTEIGKLSSAPATDRTRRYFPYVIGSGNGLTPSGATVTRANSVFFPHAQLATAVTLVSTAFPASLVAARAPVADITSLTGATAAATYYASYTGPSQALIFLRVFTYDGRTELSDTLSASQRRQLYNGYLESRGPVLDFGADDDSDLPLWNSTGNHATLGISYASQIYDAGAGNWSLRPGASDTVAYGVPLESGYVVTGSDGALRILPQWESLDPPDHERPADENDWREYLYTVVRSPYQGRFGRLVRAHKVLLAAPLPPVGVEVGQIISSGSLGVGDEAMVIDRILSDNVSRITFDTYRTDRLFSTDEGRLDINQVRVRLYLTRPDQLQQTVLTRVATATFTMRVKGTETQRNDDLLLLGTTRPGFPR
ncbi:MAG TPA: hypothetical protein DCS97_08495 [Planctomycetes bacterium]|nr:hypothetical protein [Planctomycetota bacterium]